VTPDPDVLASILLKAVGSVIGAILAILFKWPKSRAEAQKRAIFSLLSGIALTPIAISIMQEFVVVDRSAETIVAVATITAFASWTCAGVLLKLTDKWGNAKE
jgi:putative effector of murein hydrolase LrgA (UPF0299 family)